MLILLKHLRRHGVAESPDHFDGAFAFVADPVDGAQVDKRHGAAVAVFLASGKGEDGAAPGPGGRSGSGRWQRLGPCWIRIPVYAVNRLLSTREVWGREIPDRP